jgi:molecular chaperone GrpE
MVKVSMGPGPQDQAGATPATEASAESAEPEGGQPDHDQA